LHPINCLQSEQNRNAIGKQLTHISSTSSGVVALPNGGSGGLSTSSFLTSKSPPKHLSSSLSPPRRLLGGMSRIERHQRLRKTAAVEEDDHNVTTVTTSTSSTSNNNTLTTSTELLSTTFSIPRHNLPNSNHNSSSFDEDDNNFGKNVLGQILGASSSQSNFPNQPLPAPVPLSINNSLNESALRLFLQQQQIKQEPFSSESVWSSKPNDLLTNQLLNIAAAQTQSQLSNFNLPPFMTSNPIELSSQSRDDYRVAVATAAAVAASTSSNEPRNHIVLI
jgi:hypothetical protein